MSHPPDLVSDLELAITTLERETSAEVVITLADRSGGYGDVDLLWGWMSGLLALAVILWSPWRFHPDFILLNVVLSSTLGWFLSRQISPLRRWLTTSGRRRSQSGIAAQVQFLAQGVDRTVGRTGILIYLSRLERTLTILPDRSVEEKLPPEMLTEWRNRFASAPNLAALMINLRALIGEMKAPLKTHLPRALDKVDELSNRPIEVPA